MQKTKCGILEIPLFHCGLPSTHLPDCKSGHLAPLKLPVGVKVSVKYPLLGLCVSPSTD